MLTRGLSLALLASVALVPLGCRGGGFSLGYHDRRPVRVTRVHTHADHVCTYDCDEHYWDGTRVVVISGHRHGRGCGHVWDGTHWVVIKKARGERVRPHPAKVVKVKHVHGASCGCAYDRRVRKWIKVKKGHVHGPGCGHVFIEGRWSLRL